MYVDVSPKERDTAAHTWRELHPFTTKARKVHKKTASGSCLCRRPGATLLAFQWNAVTCDDCRRKRYLA